MRLKIKYACMYSGVAVRVFDLKPKHRGFKLYRRRLDLFRTPYEREFNQIHVQVRAAKSV